MKLKKINKIEVLAILVALPVFFILLNSNKVILTQPDMYSQSTNITPEFLFSSNLDVYRIVVDDDSDFSSPVINEIILENTFTPDFGLSFGKYYWKVIGFKDQKSYESKTSVFELVSLVSTEVTSDIIRNTGNTKISVKEALSTPGAYSVVGLSILDVGEFAFRNQTQSEVVSQQI